MKPFYYLIAFAFLFAGCAKTEEASETKTRTVYFMNVTAKLADGTQSRPLRAMIDPLEFNGPTLLATELAVELNFPTYELSEERVNEQRASCPSYDLGDYSCNAYVFWCGTEPINGWTWIADFDRQERITGQRIDVVFCCLGGALVHPTYFSKMPIDLTLTVPYDWGTSQE